MKEVLTAKDRDGERPLDILFVVPLFSSITSNDKDSITSILSEARECTILREVLTAKDKIGYTALHYTAKSGNADVVEKILATISNDKEILKEVLTAKNKDGETALYSAVRLGKVDVVEKILAAIGDNKEILKEMLNAKDQDGNTVLRYAVRLGKADVVEKILATISNDKEILKEVLTAKNNDGKTVLHSAAQLGKADAVGKILVACANDKDLLKEVLTAKNNDGKTVLHSAANSINSGVFEKILEVGKELDILTLCSSDYFVKECKDLVTPAKSSNMVPSSWVKNISEVGTYWKERDALIEEVVEKYLTDHGHIKITDKDGNQTYLITEQIDKIKSEIRDNIASHKEEITEFLNKKGHYNVQPKIIKEELEKRDNEGKSFVEKLQEKKIISSPSMPIGGK